MAKQNWQAVDEYVSGLLAPADEALRGALEASAAAGLPEIQVTAPQAKLLALLAEAIGARAILEFGTLGGYSTVWLARALPQDGRLVTLEADPRNAEVAAENIARAGLADIVDLRVGPALESLPPLEAEGAGPFDFVFIDADKARTPEYFAWSLDHTRPGGLIVADNVVRGGELAKADSDDPTIPAQRRLHEQIAADPRVEATTIQTVGAKGHDGFTLARVAGRPVDQPPSMAATSKRDDAASVARAYFEAIAARDTAAMMSLWEPGGVGDIHGLVQLRAPDTYAAWFANLFAAVPDWRMEILDLVAEGDKAAVRWHATGTFDGSARFEGMLPTGAEIDITGFDLLTVHAGRIQRNEAYLNGSEMAQQLGALPPPGSARERAMIGALNLKTRLARALRRR